jgi:hypothetical protein
MAPDCPAFKTNFKRGLQEDVDRKKQFLTTPLLIELVSLEKNPNLQRCQWQRVWVCNWSGCF